MTAPGYARAHTHALTPASIVNHTNDAPNYKDARAGVGVGDGVPLILQYVFNHSKQAPTYGVVVASLRPRREASPHQWP